MVFIIKKVCELSKEELNIKEREFRKTAFGHRLYDFKVTMIIEEVFFFIFMFILKKFGDFIFKRESMGGGDIKLLFILGMVLSFPIAALSIFVGSVIGLPISIFLLNKDESHIIPFGPFLAAGAILLLLTKIDLNTIINFYNY